ncbi:class D sortase [Fictibacillus nanhaiensis]|jgi:sortase A|uniref:class D sortase n=1 Tax=Fictibacillus nanhaiensis TaxID=742169 RepID=UPI00203B5992|nr:class D sortase [Fictibacillus nanhaiensis]MCM3731618.1 class D sortase [Fictibacillus nanhaiensis]
MKWLAYLLIAAGLSTMFYPKAKSMYYSYQEKQLLEDWESSDEDSEILQSYQQLDDVFLDESQPKNTPTPQKTKNGIIGKLEINKIDLTIPIMEGASQANLKVAAGHLKGTSPVGEVGNSAIAAHRSYTYGKQFNRLPEVEVGDTIRVITKDKKLTYRIIDEMIVLPDDLSVLKKDASESTLTLITCHPMKNPTHRYIVKAVLDKEEVL